MRRSILVVPPLVKSLAGPLAGPTWLAGVAHAEGARLDVVDLNARWLRSVHPWRLPDLGGPSGDHAKPVGGLRVAARAWGLATRRSLPRHIPERGCEGRGLRADFGGVYGAAEHLSRGWMGRWVSRWLGAERPRMVGVSVLWEGQVLGALAASIVARRRWPGVPVIWGGAHVTAMFPEIVRDARYGRHVDGFVAGYAEETFRAMLRGDPLAAPGVAAAGRPPSSPTAEDPTVVPFLRDASLYGSPRLTLPLQASRGCAYGRCTFCTYPAVEGRFRGLPQATVRQTADDAIRRGAELAMRDAFATPRNLERVASVVDGRTGFAATTRLVPRLGRRRLIGLVRAGLRTLELGVETVDPELLVLVDKRQAPEAVRGWLADAAGLDLRLVLNVMFGFPGQSLEDAVRTRELFDIELRRRFPRTRFTVERNLLQLERRSPMAASPDRYDITILGSAPWSSVLAWDAPPWRTSFRIQTPLPRRLWRAS